MIVETLDQYTKIPNGTILNIIPTGDAWDYKDIGQSIKCIKVNDKLYELKPPITFYKFSERNDHVNYKDGYYEDYCFIVVAANKDIDIANEDVKDNAFAN